MQTMLSACGFEHIIRVDAQKFPERHLAGCSLSHHIALNEVDVPFIVFEDDCVDINFEPVIEVPDDSDAVYLGISSWGNELSLWTLCSISRYWQWNGKGV